MRTPEELGNYTYGYIGAALGFPLEVLYAGSFVAADKSTSEKLQNEFNDWGEIKKGYGAYR
ncbi:MAG: polymorphic toxin type 44 domain-containing protein [Oscillospiraceae bacterium]|nr:polymorphic toxin type 44 domain-containing protein [Oscillospiraceae bacterium]